jgi:hypothetical protein
LPLAASASRVVVGDDDLEVVAKVECGRQMNRIQGAQADLPPPAAGPGLTAVLTA